MSIGTPVDLGNNGAAGKVLTTTADAPAGSLIILTIGDWDSPNGDITPGAGCSVTDSAGNTYSFAVQDNNGWGCRIWYVSNALHLSLGGTITLSGAPESNYYLTGASVSGAKTLDKTATFDGTGTSMSFSTPTLSSANEIAFGNGTSELGRGTILTNSFTRLAGGLIFYLTQPNSSAAITWSETWTNNTAFTNCVATFRGTSATISPNAGSYSITGNSLSQTKTNKLTISAGSYSLTGKSLSELKTLKATTASGSYSLSGKALGERATFKISASAGNYSFTGKSVTLSLARSLQGASGSYSLTGKSLSERAAFKISASAGFYSFTGKSITLNAAAVTAFQIAISSGSYSVSGKSEALARRFTASVGRGSYSLTGKTQSQLRTAKTILSPGLYTLNNQDYTIESATASYTTEDGSSSYQVGAAAAINLFRVRGFSAQAGFYGVNRENLTLNLNRAIDIQPNAGLYLLNSADYLTEGSTATYTTEDGSSSYFIGTPAAARLLKGSRTIAQAGSYSFTGEASRLLRGAKLYPIVGSYSLAGKSLGERVTFLMGANAGFYTSLGSPASITKAIARMVIRSVIYTYSGNAVTLLKPGNLFSIGAGFYSLTGEADQLIKTSKATLQAGSYSISGESLGVTRTAALRLITGAYSLTGEALSQRRTGKLTISAGGYSLSGKSDRLFRVFALAPDGGFYSLSGEAEAIRKRIMMQTAAGSYSLTGEPLPLTFSGVFSILSDYFLVGSLPSANLTGIGGPSALTATISTPALRGNIEMSTEIVSTD